MQEKEIGNGKFLPNKSAIQNLFLAFRAISGYSMAEVMHMFSLLKKICGRAGRMCRPAYIILRISLIVSCILLCSALLCFVAYNAGGALRFRQFAQTLFELPAAILFLGVIASACAEDAFAQ